MIDKSSGHVERAERGERCDCADCAECGEYGDCAECGERASGANRKQQIFRRLFALTFVPYLVAILIFVRNYFCGVTDWLITVYGVESFDASSLIVFIYMFIIPVIPIAFHIQMSVLVRKLFCKKVPLKKFVTASVLILMTLLGGFYLFLFRCW